jgi:two-component system, LytTR family, sensor kinase
VRPHCRSPIHPHFPHFLFNALNSIRALIDEDPTRVREMVTQLSELFRSSLRTTRRADLSVGDEMAVIKNYLDIQRIRLATPRRAPPCPAA